MLYFLVEKSYPLFIRKFIVLTETYCTMYFFVINVILFVLLFLLATDFNFLDLYALFHNFVKKTIFNIMMFLFENFY